jgi:tetratricopeptide (TPR) repeat protein
MEALAFTLSNLSERKVQISIIPKLAVKFFRQLQSRHSARNAAALVDALSVSYAGESAEDSARRLEERSLLAKFWLSHHLGGSSAPHSASPDKRLRTLRHISALLNVELPLNADFAWVQDHFHNPPLSRHSPSDPLSRARLGLSGLNAIGHHVRVLDRVPRPFTSSTLANSHDPAASLAIFQAVTINDSSSVALLAKAIALLRRNIRKGRQGSGVHQRPIEANDLWRFIYLLGRLGESLWVAGDVEEALSSYAEAIFAVKAFRAAEWPPPNCHDPTSGKQLIAEILFGYGASLFGCRRYLRAARVFMEAFELYQTVPDRDGRNQSSCRTAHAVSLYYSGDAISAVQAHDEVVKNWRQRQKDFGISDTGLHIVNANQPYCLHDFGRALELLECHREACLAYGEAIVLVSQDLINGLASAGRNDDFDKYVGRRVREWHIWSRTYPLVKSLVLLGHCFLDSNRRTDAATAYQHAIDLVTLLESKYPDDFPQFEALWSVSRALGVGWGQTCVEALKSLRVRVNVGADTKGDSSIGAPSINSNNGAHADVRDLQVALDGIQYFALRWWPPSPEGGEDISWGPQLDGRL